MQIDWETHEAHEAYINHAMGCRSCHPPTKRYCDYGWSLHDDYLAYCLASLDLHDRRQFLARLEVTNSMRCEAIKARLIEIFAQRKEE